MLINNILGCESLFIVMFCFSSCPQFHSQLCGTFVSAYILQTLSWAINTWNACLVNITNDNMILFYFVTSFHSVLHVENQVHRMAPIGRIVYSPKINFENTHDSWCR